MTANTAARLCQQLKTKKDRSSLKILNALKCFVLLRH